MKRVFYFLFTVLFLNSGFTEETYPVIILGEGVGGLTSALYLARAGIKPLVLSGERIGGALAQSHSIQNWPGEIEISGLDLLEKMHRQAEFNGVEFSQEQLIKVNLSAAPFELTVQDLTPAGKTRSLRTHSLIIAMGSVPNFLKIPGETAYWTKGVYQCASCDGPLFKGKTVAVVGGGNSALQDADLLSKIAKDVHIFVRKSSFRPIDEMRKKSVLARSNVHVHYETEILEIKGDGDIVTALSLFSKRENRSEEMPIDGLFLAIGSTPNTQLFTDQIHLDTEGYILANEQKETSIKGIFAVGDIAKSNCKQAVCAAADGALASFSVESYLSKASPITATTALSKNKKIASDPTANILEISSEKTFSSELSNHSKKLVLADFYASWCGPCRRIAPILENWAKLYPARVKLLKINVDTLPDLATKYQVRSMPTLLIFDEGGQLLERKVGTQEIQAALSEYAAQAN